MPDEYPKDTKNPMGPPKSRKHAKVEGTPTPLRMMEDPTLWHVMPSRTSRKKEKSTMEPPPPKKKKIVLDEETYGDAIGRVIERDYFPDLDKYRSYLEVGYGEAT